MDEKLKREVKKLILEMLEDQKSRFACYISDLAVKSDERQDKLFYDLPELLENFEIEEYK